MTRTTDTAPATSNAPAELGLVEFVNRPDVQPYIVNAAHKLRSQRHRAMLSGYKGMALAVGKAFITAPVIWWQWCGLNGFIKHLGLASAALIAPVAIAVPIAIVIEILPIVSGSAMFLATTIMTSILSAGCLMLLTAAKYLIKFIAR